MRGVFGKVVGAGVCGSAHQQAGAPAEDCVRTVSGKGIMAAVLADGAGSASRARTGAELATEVALDAVVRHFEDIWHHPESARDLVLAPVRCAIAARAQADQERDSAYACTLLFCVVRYERQRVRYVCGNLGDGVIAYRTETEVRLLLGPENAEHANETWFVTSTDAAERLRCESGRARPEDLPGWILSTDGAAGFLYGRRSGRVAPVILGLLEDLRTKKADAVERTARKVLEQAIAPRTDDDCTLGLLQIVARGTQRASLV